MPKKQRNKGPKRPKAVPAVKLGKPVFTYTSTCCSVPATKTPCKFVGKDSDEAKTQSLGSWRCPQCGKPCSCTRSKAEAEETPDVRGYSSPATCCPNGGEDENETVRSHACWISWPQKSC
jgi:hypothetical protein